MDAHVAKKLGCRIEVIPSLNVVVDDGNKVHILKSFEWNHKRKKINDEMKSDKTQEFAIVYMFLKYWGECVQILLIKNYYLRADCYQSIIIMIIISIIII